MNVDVVWEQLNLPQTTQANEREKQANEKTK
jgi:hypothetical protein